MFPTVQLVYRPGQTTVSVVLLKMFMASYEGRAACFSFFRKYSIASAGPSCSTGIDNTPPPPPPPQAANYWLLLRAIVGQQARYWKLEWEQISSYCSRGKMILTATNYAAVPVYWEQRNCPITQSCWATQVHVNATIGKNQFTGFNLTLHGRFHPYIHNMACCE